MSCRLYEIAKPAHGRWITPLRRAAHIESRSGRLEHPHLEIATDGDQVSRDILPLTGLEQGAI